MNPHETLGQPEVRLGNERRPRTLADGVALVRTGKLKPSSWLEECLAAIDKFDGTVSAFQFVDATSLRKSVAHLDDADWAAEVPFPSLAGAPVAVKDIFNTVDMPTGMGSDLRKDYRPGNDARVVGQIRELGGYALGKTKTAEFAVHSHPDTRNPWNGDVIPGTSSTGSAVAVACGMAPAALGTQSAGSISRPSSYCGVIGFKPTFGLVPRTGVLKTCDTLDTVGWMTTTVTDAVLLLESLRVRGHNYPQVVRGFRAAAERKAESGSWRVAWGRDPGSGTARDYAREAVQEFALQTGNRGDVALSEMDLTTPLGEAHDVHRVIYHKALSYYFTREMAHVDLISESFRKLVDEGQSFGPGDYHDALARQEDLSEAFESAMADTDVFISLATAGEAPGWSDEEVPDSSLVWTLCGGPSITLPVFRGPNGLPYSVQLVAKRYDDYRLLEFAKSLFPGQITPAPVDQ